MNKKIFLKKTFLSYLIILIISGCSNPLEENLYYHELNNKENALINIVIGEIGSGARTTIPNNSAIAGYQITFSGGGHEPIKITGSNQTQIILGNGNWTITATAYKLGGEIGNNNDAVAAGSISISVVSGQVIGGVVQSITLKPIGTGTGTFHYSIRIDTGVTGTLSLWNISGETKITGFGNNGDLNLSPVAVDGLANGFYNLTTGKYIAEVRLTNSENNISFKRDVIEIWQNTFTTFELKPSVFLDPNAVLPNNKAILCETTSTIGGVPIGTGTGSGLNEEDPKTYTCYPDDVSIMLLFEFDSLGSKISWVVNEGKNPDGEYPNTRMPSVLNNILTNNVLWVKAISEDTTSETMYYKFIIPSLNFGEINIATNNFINISNTNGLITITDNGTYKIGMKDGINSTTTNRILISPEVIADITLLDLNINVGSTNNACAFDMTGATVNITLIGENVLRSGSRRAGIEVPEASTLVITEVSTGSLTANGGSDSSGIGGGDYGTGGTISITGGTVTATGYYNAAGIGGGYGGSGGIISITGGTVTANGGSDSSGIGGGYYGTGGTINTITGNAVIIASSIQPDLPTGSNLGPAIVFNGVNGIMYDNVTLARDVTIPSYRILDIINNQTLTIENDYILTNNGSIYSSGNIIGTVAGNQPIESSFIVSGSTTYTYLGGVLTITGNGNITIGMRSGVTSITAERIVVSSGVTANITLSGVNINVSSLDNVCAFNMTGAIVNLTLIGENVLGSGRWRAGLEVPDGSTLVITEASTGSLAATSSYGGGGAGIGGSFQSSGGTISITGGTVTATGAGSGAGIGGGGSGSGGTISITGGIVTAIGGNGIGGGSGGSGGTINAITGNAVIFASSIQPYFPTGSNIGPAIVFIGNNGTMYGNVSLARNVTIPSGRILNILNYQTLIIEKDYILTNNGSIYNYGNIIGTVAENQPIEPRFTISGNAAYTYLGGILTITENGTYTIGMRNGVTSITAERIVVASGVTANITLNGVNINRSSTGYAAFSLVSATVYLTLVGENVLRSGSGRAGLEAPEGSTLVITEESTGSLAATGSNFSQGSSTYGGAGIGGSGSIGTGGTGGTISIAGGTVTATGGYGAGIGGGGALSSNMGGSGGTISITGGTVTATGYGAGIGGGYNGSGGTISITGGTVTATGGNSGAGIGGGYYGSGGTINAISGNAVIFASSINATLPSAENLGPAIVFNGANGTMYGNVTLARNETIPLNRILSIGNNQTLTIQNSFTLTNNGTIINSGNIVGTVTGNQPIEPSFNITGDTAYNYQGVDQGLVLTITGNGSYTISMRNGVTSITAERIVVASGVTANITLNGVNIINVSSTDSVAFSLVSATVYLTLIGENVLRGGTYPAGLQVPDGSTLVVTEASTGTLSATGNYGAGIGGGGGNRSDGGTIIIEGGTVIATSNYGAGIGGNGYGGSGGTISITGGTVTATGGFSSAGIGGGNGGSGGTISITGGTVTATSRGSLGIGGAGGIINAIGGNSVIFASSITADFPIVENLGPAIVFIGNNGIMYGNVSLQQNVTFASGGILPISAGRSLTIPNGITLTNNGTINNNGTIYRYGVIAGSGSITGNQPVQ